MTVWYVYDVCVCVLCVCCVFLWWVCGGCVCGVCCVSVMCVCVVCVVCVYSCQQLLLGRLVIFPLSVQRLPLLYQT